MSARRVTRFQCTECGKITSGRWPRAPWHKGDTTFRFPRRHKGKDGKPCPGNVYEAAWIDVAVSHQGEAE